VATNCDSAALLGTVGELIDSGVKSYARGTWVGYRDGLHIPPGGNYFTKTRFVTGSNGNTDCFMIAAAFADFRSYVPFFTPYSERNYFYSYLGWGSVKNLDQLKQRLLMDIEGVLKTCIDQNIDTLVTGATGCGAFLHNPYLEAELWSECLKRPEYQQLGRGFFHSGW